MADIVLRVEVREQTGTGAARAVRREGKVPGVLYGGDKDPVAISVAANEFRKALYTGKLLGHLVTLITFVLLARTGTLDVGSGLPGWVAHVGAFGWFRVFDILKLYPCNRLERLPGALGIMADDQVAGVYAGVALWLSMPVALSVLG